MQLNHYFKLTLLCMYEFPALLSAQVLVSGFLGILFLQSGFDKVFDYTNNFEWLKGHFASSPLKGVVAPMLVTITIIEVLAGIFSFAGSLLLLFSDQPWLALIGAQISALALVMLFFGQRLAKDYEGAAGLTGYFIITLLAIVLLGTSVFAA